ncbi:MAG: hypothetical protein RLZZ63_309 [Gemmatimonadota bacterium]
MSPVRRLFPYARILASPELTWREKVKQLASYARMRRGQRRLWQRRFQVTFRRNPHLAAKTTDQVVRAHVHLWTGVGAPVNLADLRIATNGSGRSDSRIVPEEIFACDIEPTLKARQDLSMLVHKSLSYRLYPTARWPRPYLHQMAGRLYSAMWQEIGPEEVTTVVEQLPFPVVIKPSTGTNGGFGVAVVTERDELVRRLRLLPDAVVQEVIYQHAAFERFNAAGLNTLRVNLYRSVVDERVKWLNAVVRMGVGGSLDNTSAGGIAVVIGDDGRMGGIARDDYGTPYARHPDSNVPFDAIVPDFDGLKSMVTEVAESIPYGRLFALDVCRDREGAWRLIEINMGALSIRHVQYAGVPFFGAYTDEVIAYCQQAHWTLRPKRTLKVTLRGGL